MTRPAPNLSLCLLAWLAAAGAAWAQKAAPLQRPAEAPPVARIPVEPLGFRPPASWVRDFRVPWATLDFVDNEHILFTFHANELMRRDQPRGEGDSSADHQDQTVRALVLKVPSGTVEEKASWRLHDRSAYLWPVGHGRFLEREGDSFYMFDGSLEHRTLYFKSPGEIVAVQVAADRHALVVEWRDPKAATEASRGIDYDEPAVRHPVRMLLIDLGSNRSDKQAELESAGFLPLVDNGYLKVAPGHNKQWDLQYQVFGGDTTKVSSVGSGCQPETEPIAGKIFLARLCLPYTSDHLMQAWTLDGHKLWEQQWNARFVWGTFGIAGNGSRFAYESLALDHPVTTLDPVSPETAQAQVVGVYDTKDGHLRLVTEADPMLTAGHNYALSDDGTRFAILRKGAIEVYEIPPAPEP